MDIGLHTQNPLIIKSRRGIMFTMAYNYAPLKKPMWLIKYTEWKDTFQFPWPPIGSVYRNEYLKQWCLVSCSTIPSLLRFSFIAGIYLELYFQLQVIHLCACSKSASHHFSSIFYCMHLEWFGWLYVANSHFYLMYISVLPPFKNSFFVTLHQNGIRHSDKPLPVPSNSAI